MPLADRPRAVRLGVVALIWGIVVVALQFPWGGGDDLASSTCYGMFRWWTVPCEAWLTTSSGAAVGLLAWLVLLDAYARMTARVLAIALVLEALWVGVGGGLLPIALGLTAFEEEGACRHCIDGLSFGLVGLGAALILGVAAYQLLFHSRGGAWHATWLALAGVANAGLATLWVVTSVQVDDAGPVIQFVVIFLTMALLCFLVVWRMNRPRDLVADSNDSS